MAALTFSVSAVYCQNVTVEVMIDNWCETYGFGWSAKAQETFADPFSLTAALCSAKVNCECVGEWRIGALIDGRAWMEGKFVRVWKNKIKSRVAGLASLAPARECCLCHVIPPIRARARGYCAPRSSEYESRGILLFVDISSSSNLSTFFGFLTSIPQRF